MSEIKKTTEYMDFESFFTTNLKDADPDLYDSLLSEFKRQQLHPYHTKPKRLGTT